MAFLISFGCIGLVAVPMIIMFLVGGVDLKHRLGGTFITLGLWLFMSFSIVFSAWRNEEVWNDGYCDCGYHWELAGATRSKQGSVTKYYFCPNCHSEIEIGN